MYHALGKVDATVFYHTAAELMHILEKAGSLDGDQILNKHIQKSQIAPVKYFP